MKSRISFAQVLKKKGRFPQIQASKGHKLADLMSQYEQYPEENYTLSYNNLASTNRSRKSSVRLLNSNQNQDNEFDSWIQRQSSTTNKENIMTQQKKTLFPSVTKGQERQIGKAIKGAGMTMNEIAKNKPVGGLMAPKAKTYGQTSTNSNFTDSRYSEEEENHTTTLDYNKTHNQVNSKQTGKTFVGIAPVKHEVNIQKEHKRSNYQLPNDEYGTEDFTQEQQEEELRHVEARPTIFYEQPQDQLYQNQQTPQVEIVQRTQLVKQTPVQGESSRSKLQQFSLQTKETILDEIEEIARRIIKQKPEEKQDELLIGGSEKKPIGEQRNDYAMAKQTRVGQQLEDSELERKRKDDAKNQLKELFKQINKGKGGNQSTENKETVQVYAEPELTHLGVGYSFSQNHVEANDHSYTHNQLDLPNQKPTEELPVQKFAKKAPETKTELQTQNFGNNQYLPKQQQPATATTRYSGYGTSIASPPYTSAAHNDDTLLANIQQVESKVSEPINSEHHSQLQTNKHSPKPEIQDLLNQQITKIESVHYEPQQLALQSKGREAYAPWSFRQESEMQKQKQIANESKESVKPFEANSDLIFAKKDNLVYQANCSLQNQNIPPKPVETSVSEEQTQDFRATWKKKYNINSPKVSIKDANLQEGTKVSNVFSEQNLSDIVNRPFESLDRDAAKQVTGTSIRGNQATQVTPKQGSAPKTQTESNLTKPYTSTYSATCTPFEYVSRTYVANPDVARLMTYHPSQYVNKTNIYQPGEYLKVVGLVSEKKTDTETNAATIKDHPLPLPTIYNGTEDASTSYLKFKNQQKYTFYHQNISTTNNSLAKEIATTIVSKPVDLISQTQPVVESKPSQQSNSNYLKLLQVKESITVDDLCTKKPIESTSAALQEPKCEPVRYSKTFAMKMQSPAIQKKTSVNPVKVSLKNTSKLNQSDEFKFDLDF